MKKILVSLCALSSSFSLFAASGSGLERGGLGLLFPDHNSAVYTNPGNMASSHGFGIEALYSNAGGSQTALPSMVYGNGKFGIGAFGQRRGTDLMSMPLTTDTAGGALAVSLLKDRITLGAGYSTTLESVMTGTLEASLTLRPANRQGVSIGVVYNRILVGGSTHGASAGIGYSFMSNKSLEANMTIADLSNFNNFTASFFFNTMKSIVYLGAGYTLTKGASISHGASGRLGFNLGSSIDLSALGTYNFGGSITWGGSFRVAI
jgi:hypothetical protein